MHNLVAEFDSILKPLNSLFIFCIKTGLEENDEKQCKNTVQKY